MKHLYWNSVNGKEAGCHYNRTILGMLKWNKMNEMSVKKWWNEICGRGETGETLRRDRVKTLSTANPPNFTLVPAAHFNSVSPILLLRKATVILAESLPFLFSFISICLSDAHLWAWWRFHLVCLVHMLRRYIVLLIAIHPSDRDVKPGNPLGSYRQE